MTSIDHDGVPGGLTANQWGRLRQQYPPATVKATLPVTAGLLNWELPVAPGVSQAAVVAGLRRIVATQPALRTVFSRDGEEWTSHIADAGGLAVMSRQDPAFGRPFDLTEPEWLRISFECRGDEVSRVHLVTDHLVFDGLSSEILVAALNEYLVGGQLPDYTTDYLEWVASQHRQMQVATRSAEAAYWHGEFADIGLYPPLPFRPGDGTPLEEVTLAGPDDMRQLRAELRRQRTSPTAVAFACTSAALSTLYDDEPRVASFAVANRWSAAEFATLGWFSNVAAVRLDIGGPQEPSEIVRLLSRRLLDAQEHARLGLHILTPELDPLDGLRRPRIFLAVDTEPAQNPGPIGPARQEPVSRFTGGLLCAFSMRRDSAALRLVGDPRVVSQNDIIRLSRAIKGEMQYLCLGRLRQTDSTC